MREKLMCMYNTEKYIKCFFNRKDKLNRVKRLHKWENGGKWGQERAFNGEYLKMKALL